MATYTDQSGTIVAGVEEVANATKAPLYGLITVTTTAQTLSTLLAAATPAVTIPSWATVAYVLAEVSSTVALRWRADGTNPTASVGWPILGYAADSSILGYNAITNASLISATGASVTVSVRIAG